MCDRSEASAKGQALCCQIFGFLLGKQSYVDGHELRLLIALGTAEQQSWQPHVPIHSMHQTAPASN